MYVKTDLIEIDYNEFVGNIVDYPPIRTRPAWWVIARSPYV
jgi:hypothetical protein